MIIDLSRCFACCVCWLFICCFGVFGLRLVSVGCGCLFCYYCCDLLMVGSLLIALCVRAIAAGCVCLVICRLVFTLVRCW